jgi:hypothetical protein
MISDAFALLALPRRAWLSPDEVRAAFQQAAAAAHPDAAADEADRVARTELFQQLNEASALLTPVTSRLKHLLALEYPDFIPSRAATMDDALVSLFSTIGNAVQAAAAWAREREAATTFLAKAALAPREMRVQEILEAAGAQLRAEQEKLDRTLREIDADPATDFPPAEILSALASRAAFLGKWQAQLQAAWTSLFSAG